MAEKAKKTSRSLKPISEVFGQDNTIWINFDEADAKALKIGGNTLYKDAKAKIRQILNLPERVTGRVGFKGELREAIKGMSAEEVKKLLDMAKKIKQ
jgi:hypothetical protein